MGGGSRRRICFVIARLICASGTVQSSFVIRTLQEVANFLFAGPAELNPVFRCAIGAPPSFSIFPARSEVDDVRHVPAPEKAAE
jgi:hypothetical protein